MSDVDAAVILDTARTRTSDSGYAGAVLPEEALALLTALPGARLVDVRTRAELDWVGRPAIPAGQYLPIEWVIWPGNQPNGAFLGQLAASAGDGPLFFLCRSGVRSKAAAKAATAAGHAECYDILEGFEGDKDAAGHRKTIGGWCKRGLPWIGA
ncbi:rhodanese-like domain-containing protein [Derxia gummosa]|uniref:Rhodanese-like domain-containing protein n=1 Tax=Derxia gummosa DSM 723 TaxID=1121388 RepID=A0A9U5CHK9_9BURK|nr:rhodanese-like domain-containing protein [Derxia gummosa]